MDFIRCFSLRSSFQVLVWHTQTLKKPPPTVKVSMELLSIVDTSLVKLFEELKFLGMGSMSTREGKYLEQ